MIEKLKIYIPFGTMLGYYKWRGLFFGPVGSSADLFFLPIIFLLVKAPPSLARALALGRRVRARVSAGRVG